MNNNPFSPPSSEVADAAINSRSSWLRNVLLVVGFSALSLALSWLLGPAIASLVPVSADTRALPPPLFFAVDVLFSFLFFWLGCYLAARLSRGHYVVAASGVAAIGWLVYFIEVGGLRGMLNSEYPLWYEFFPIHILAAVIAILFARRREC